MLNVSIVNILSQERILTTEEGRVAYETWESMMAWFGRKTLKPEDRTGLCGKEEERGRWQGWLLRASDRVWKLRFQQPCISFSFSFFFLLQAKHFLTKSKTDPLPHTATVSFGLLAIQTLIASGTPTRLKLLKKVSWLILSLVLIKALKCFSSERYFSPATDPNGANLDQWCFWKYSWAGVWDLHLLWAHPSADPALDSPGRMLLRWAGDHTKLITLSVKSS